MKVLCLVIVSVNVTKYMPQKCQIRQICGYQVCFSSSKYSKTRLRPGLCPGPRWRSLRRSPRPSSRLGRGIPPPHSLPSSTPSASRISAPSASWLSGPQHKFLATPMLLDRLSVVEKYCRHCSVELGHSPQLNRQ